MHGDGADASVADQVVEEISARGRDGRGLARLGRQPRGRRGDRRHRRRAVRSARCGGEQRGHLQQHPVRRADAGRLAAHAARAPRRRVLSEPTRVPGDEDTGLRPIRLHLVVGGHVRPAPGGPLRRGQGRPRRVDQRHRHRRRAARNPRQHRAALRLLADGHRNRRRPESPRGDRVLECDQPELVIPMVVYPRQPGLRVQPSQLLGLRRPLRPRVHRPRRGLARRARQRHRRPTTSRRISPRSRRQSRSRSRNRSTKRSSRSAPNG